MKHDELLAKIDSFTCCSGAHELALRAVVELHKPNWILPEIYLPPKPEPIAICTHCSDDQWRKSYPCPTIQAIEKELM